MQTLIMIIPMDVLLKITGTILVVLALLHSIFPKYFNWDTELAQLSLINRQMTKVHTFFIAFVVFLMGLLCLVETTDLIDTALGKNISLGLGVFWLTRLIIQFFGYSTKLWKGKRFETVVHIIFSILWMFLSGVFLLNYSM